MSILDTIERALFGASAAEIVEMRIKLAEQRIEQKIIAAFETLDEDENEAGESAGGDDELHLRGDR